jgi:hypothetical protein
VARIFISYRRLDSAYVADAIKTRLWERFGKESVFFDIDTIPLGGDFRSHITHAVNKCDVLLAIIGDQWLIETGANGQRRLDDPADYVRLEIEAALKRGIPVIPVLVGQTVMPAISHLPDSLKELGYRNAAEIRAGRDLGQHLDRLVAGIHNLSGGASSDPGSSPNQPDPRKNSKPPDKPVASKDVELSPDCRATASSTTSVVSVPELLHGYKHHRLFVRPTIPYDRLTTALASYGEGVVHSHVLLLFDNSIFGGGKYGLFLTDNALYWRNWLADNGTMQLANVRSTSWCALGEEAGYLLVNDIKIDAASMGGLRECMNMVCLVIDQLRASRR